MSLLLSAMLVGRCCPVQAQDATSSIVVSGESAQTARRLVEADKLAAAGQWSEAIDEYQRILEQAGDDLVLVAADEHGIQARRLCHLRLAALPTAALELYRDRVDGRAQKWLEQGEADRDPRWLRRVVDEAFCSHASERALDLLGDFAFERGDFATAESWWQKLALPAEAAQAETGKPAFLRSLRLVYPGPQLDQARVRAKQILARLFGGERDRLDEALAAFRALHGKAAGDLAGRTGNYADTLQSLARPGDGLAPPPDEAAWTTFAGAPSRNRVPLHGPGRLHWRVPLDDSPWPRRLDHDADDEESRPGVLTPSAAARCLAFHPIVVGDQVLVADARYVKAFDLVSGQQTIWYDLVKDGQTVAPDMVLKLPAPPDLRYTLTVADDQVYARMGAQSLGRAMDDEGIRQGKYDTFLVCLNRRADREGRRQRWMVKANVADRKGAVTFFEGAPVVHEGRVLIAMTRFEGAARTTAIACYDADTGAPRWKGPVEVCTSRGAAESERRWRHHLLTLAGPNVVYGSQDGAVIALEADTGRRAWAARYPSRGTRTSEGEPSPRDLAPCVYAAGRLVAAPADFGHILCLDADTGQNLWTSEPALEGVHLLGIAGGKLVFTTPQDIRALDVTTGLSVPGWIQPDEGSGRLSSYGRGFLADGLVFWPTQEGLRVLKLDNGEPAEEWYPFLVSRDRLGNLALGDGCLIAVNDRSIWAYVPEARRLGEHRKEAAVHPNDAWTRYRLARAEAEGGLEVQAVHDLAEAERLAGADERRHEVRLRELARNDRHELLLELADRADKLRQRDDAESYLAQAAAVEFSVDQRLRALARHAELCAAIRPARALAAWQAILDEERLRNGRIVNDGMRYPAGAFATDRIAELIHIHGSAVYEPFEQRARMLAASVAEEHRPEGYERLAQQFPNASVTGPALLQLAALCDQADRPGDAAQAYRLALQRDDAVEHVSALVGLAHAYEHQHCKEAARSIWQRLIQECGDRTLANLDPEHTVRSFVAEHLARDQRLAAPLPVDAWQVALSPTEQLLPDNGTAAGDPSAALFFVGDGTLTCRDAVTGKMHWRRELAHLPSWLARQGDRVLVAGADGMAGLSLADGQVLWELALPEMEANDERDGEAGLPFSGFSAAALPLAHFHLADSRLFCLQGEQRLWAVDVERGSLMWSRWAPGARVQPQPPGGRFCPLYHAGPQWVVVQTTTGRILVLSSHNGRSIHQSTLGSEAWRRPPLALEHERLCLVPDEGRVVLFDPATSQVLWTHPTPRPTISSASAQVLGDSRVLLLLVDGWQLQRIDALTGQSRWSCALGTEPVESERAALTSDAFYYVNRNVLYARALADGRSLWQRPLTGARGPWRALASGGYVLALPLQAELELDRAWVSGGYLVGFPWERLWRDLPVWICPLNNSHPGQCLHLTRQGPTVRLQALQGALIIGLPGQLLGVPVARLPQRGEAQRLP